MSTRREVDVGQELVTQVSEELFDVWSDANHPTPRYVVVQRGQFLPFSFIAKHIVKLSPVRVTDEIKSEVRKNGHCCFVSTMPFNPHKVLDLK